MKKKWMMVLIKPFGVFLILSFASVAVSVEIVVKIVLLLVLLLL